MKKAIYSAVSPFLIWASFSVAVTADSVQPVPQGSFFSFLNQARIGLGFAVEYANYENNIKIEPISGDLGPIQYYQSQTGRKFLIAPSIELGKAIANHYYLGLVASWHYTGVKDTSMAPFRGQNYLINESKLNQYIDVLLKAGFKLTPRAMVYGLVGPSFANWSHTTDQRDGRANLVTRFSIEKKTIGLGFGLGFEYQVGDRYAISADYTHHLHRSVSKTQVIDSFFNGRDHTGNVLKIAKPSYGTIAVRFTTYFSL